eukprot:CAMPEP_0172931524 /NCGR_PEP_ID=MMETSP1075-20121228/219540_1 /TAXON_ID=2916 /ORGANISM="Ceratium fusus, Strain PA161109" /LENGTH=461 /DNA_ID=CAMNT_0013792847 /DNA_START=16 /DNA_END=1404 /DNA_ORIENTATION=-
MRVTSNCTDSVGRLALRSLSSSLPWCLHGIDGKQQVAPAHHVVNACPCCRHAFEQLYHLLHRCNNRKAQTSSQGNEQMVLQSHPWLLVPGPPTMEQFPASSPDKQISCGSADIAARSTRKGGVRGLSLAQVGRSALRIGPRIWQALHPQQGHCDLIKRVDQGKQVFLGHWHIHAFQALSKLNAINPPAVVHVECLEKRANINDATAIEPALTVINNELTCAAIGPMGGGAEHVLLGEGLALLVSVRLRGPGERRLGQASSTYLSSASSTRPLWFVSSACTNLLSFSCEMATSSRLRLSASSERSIAPLPSTSRALKMEATSQTGTPKRQRPRSNARLTWAAMFSTTVEVQAEPAHAEIGVVQDCRPANSSATQGSLRSCKILHLCGRLIAIAARVKRHSDLSIGHGLPQQQSSSRAAAERQNSGKKAVRKKRKSSGRAAAKPAAEPAASLHVALHHMSMAT